MPHLKVTSVLCKLAVFFVDAAAAILAQFIKTCDRLSITEILSLEMCVCLTQFRASYRKTKQISVTASFHFIVLINTNFIMLAGVYKWCMRVIIYCFSWHLTSLVMLDQHIEGDAWSAWDSFLSMSWTTEYSLQKEICCEYRILFNSFFWFVSVWRLQNSPPLSEI